MTKSKKVLALILAAMMLSFSLLACSDNNSNSNVNDDDKNQGNANSGNSTPNSDKNTPPSDGESETEPELDDGLGNPNLNGYKFRILSCYFSGDEAAHRMMYEEETGNPVNDELYKSKCYIEERFNINYEVISGGNEFETQTTTKTTINAGDNAFDIVISHDGLTFNLAKEGLFYNLRDIEQFDFTKPWWPDGSVTSLSLCNQMYCASSYLTYTGLHWTRAIMINKDIAEQKNLEIPYDIVREGKWTVDAMLAYVNNQSDDLDGNGVFDKNDQIAFVTGSQTFYCLQEAMDIPIYRRDAEGMPYLDIDVEKIDTYVQKFRTLINSNDYLYIGAGGEETFKEGKNLLCYGQLKDAYDHYRASDMVYGFLPTPKFDENQENYINCCTDLPWAVPKTITAEQAGTIGTIVEAISCYNYKNVLPAYFEVAMKARTADSPDDADMLQLIADTRTISFAYSYGMNFNNILGELGDSNREVASYIKGSQKIASKALQKLVETFQKFDEINKSSAQ